jgi:RimJ/RimL family protein N-acetyltransferase
MNIYLETQRLVLRRFTEADADRLLALDSDPEVLRHTGTRPLPDAAAYRRHIRTGIVCYYHVYQGYGFWAVVEKVGGRFIGWFCLRPALDSPWAAALGYGLDDVELDCRLQRSIWGQGYATEVAQALLRKALTELGASWVVASASAVHAAALRVLEKAGLRRLKGLFPLPGLEEPFVKYSLSRAEFQRSQRGG